MSDPSSDAMSAIPRPRGTIGAGVGLAIARFGAAVCTGVALCGFAARAIADDNPYNDPPPAQATRGIADCPAPKVRVLSPEQARREAHQRVERGTSCWLAGQCEAGGDYKDDDRVNARVAAAIAADPRFATSTVWVETLRKFVTLKGCVVDESQGRAVEALARSVDGVKRVWLETTVIGSAPR